MDRTLAPPSKGKTAAKGPELDRGSNYGKRLGDGDGVDFLASQSVFQVIGTNCQILNIQLQPKQKVRAISKCFGEQRSSNGAKDICLFSLVLNIATALWRVPFVLRLCVLGGGGIQVLCEPGSLMHGSSEIVPSTKCFWSCSRACAGESQFITRFRNEGSTPAILGLTVPVPNAKVSSRLLLLYSLGSACFHQEILNSMDSSIASLQFLF